MFKRGVIITNMNQSLDLLTPNTTSKAGHGIVYGYMVKGARFFLVIGILSVITVVFLWPDMRTPPRIQPDVAGIDTATNRLEHPRFNAVDGSGQPYELNAVSAVQNKATPDRIDLVAPTGRIDLKDGKKIGLMGTSGVYQQQNQIMNLSGGVKLIEDKGMELQSDQMTIDMKSQTVTAPGTVNVTGPMGTLKASGMTGKNKDGIIIFHGPAKMTLPQGGATK
jgi:LPS export ABC transporter protein LptC